MGKYATISVPVEVKARLEEVKGEGKWAEFLLEMYTVWQQLKGKKAFEDLRKLFSEEDLEAIRESSKEFRENFRLR